jgi:hypothetical protein
MPLRGLRHCTVLSEQYRIPRAAAYDAEVVTVLGTDNTSKHPIAVHVLADCPIALSNNVENGHEVLCPPFKGLYNHLAVKTSVYDVRSMNESRRVLSSSVTNGNY